MLQFRNYQKSYGDKLIIAAQELSLPAPFYWLKGGNGSGKSTLLQSIAGIIPFRGDILVNGHQTRGQQVAFRLAVNHAAAEPAYPDFLSGYDLVSFYTAAKKGTKAQVNLLIEQLGIGSYLRDKAGTYSSGMKKKLSLVLAFIGQPGLILLDEPLITLDAAAVQVLTALISSSVSAGVQLLITSHQEMTGDTFVEMPRQLLIVDKQLQNA